MRKIIAPFALLVGLLLPASSLAQVNLSKLPASTVVGRLATPSTGGSSQAIPFATFFNNNCVAFGSSVPGCVPASGGGTTNYLRADGTWAPAVLALTTAHFFVGNGSNVPTDVAMSGDCTLASSGAVTCTKTNGVSFATSATTDTTSATNITSGTLPTGRYPSIADGHLLANGTGGATNAADTAPSTWMDHAFCNTVGYLAARFTSTWLCSRGAPVNVTWFGVATGNSGSTNSSDFAAAQSACGACTYYLPAASSAYNFASTIVLGDKQWLVCEGMSSTNINMSSANTNTVQIGGSGTNTGHQRITGCYFTTSASQTGTNVIYTQNAHNIYIDHIIISGGANGIFIGGSAGGGGDGFFQFISNFYIVSVTNIGIAVGGSGSGSPAGVYLNNGTIYSSASAGIFIAQTGGFEMHAVEATLNGSDGLLIAPGAGQSALYMFVSDCFFDTNTDDGIKIAPTSTGIVELLSVVNSWVATNVQTGIGVIGGGSTTVNSHRFVGNTIFNNARGGFYQNGGTGTVLNSNSILCNNTASTGTDNVNFNSTTHAAVVGNQIGSHSLCGTNVTYNLNFQAANDYTMYVGNDTSTGFGTGAINTAGVGAHTATSGNL